MKKEKSHYDVLGVDKGASKETIKQAFKDQVRAHPPEQDPEGFQRVQEAYHVLSNSGSRDEYDNMSQHGERIDALREEAEALMHQEESDFETAAQKLKRAIVLGPKIGLLRDMLGQCYLATDDAAKAVKQFERAVSLDGKNKSYKVHLGQAFRKNDALNQAEDVLRDAWRTDQANAHAGRALAAVLYDQDQTDHALAVLDQTIDADGRRDFEDFSCYHDKLQILAMERDHDALAEEMDMVVSLAEETHEKRFASFALVQTGQSLYEIGAFTQAHQFLEGAVEMAPDKANLRGVERAFREMSELESEVEELVERDDIHDYVKHIVVTLFRREAGAISESELTRQAKDIAETIEPLMGVDPRATEVRDSRSTIKAEYPRINEVCSGILSTIDTLPEAPLFSAPCPHCGETVTANKSSSARGTCPDCGGTVIPQPSSYSFKKPYSSGLSRSSPSSSTSSSSTTTSSTSRDSSSTNQSSGNGCLWGMAIFFVLMFLVSMCG